MKRGILPASEMEEQEAFTLNHAKLTKKQSWEVRIPSFCDLSRRPLGDGIRDTDPLLPPRSVVGPFPEPCNLYKRLCGAGHVDPTAT